jgi:hypothetical protein
MNHRRHTLLAGIAAIALTSGVGLASAQQPPEHQGAQAKEPHAATQPMNKAPAAGKMSQGNDQGAKQSAQQPNRGAAKIGQNAQEEHPGAMNKPNQRAETEHSTKAGKPTAGENRAAQTERQKQGATAQRNEARPNGPKTGENKTGANERKGLEGLQGNAQGNAGGVQLNDQQRTQIRSTVINAAGAPRVGSVNFNVAVGTVIPRGEIRVVPVPETLVRIDPEWRGFLYFVYEDELIIVNPHDMRIVAVVYV